MAMMIENKEKEPSVEGFKTIDVPLNEDLDFGAI